MFIFSQFFAISADFTQLPHWAAHITAHSFLVAFGDIKAVHTQCNTTPMNTNINPSKHSGCYTHHLFSHQELFILATSRVYGFSIGGLRLSMRCNWEHRSTGVTCGPSCFGWSKFWDHVVVGLCTIEPWRWGHCAVSKRWVTNTLWRSAILQKDRVSYNSHKQC